MGLSLKYYAYSFIFENFFFFSQVLGIWQLIKYIVKMNKETSTEIVKLMAEGSSDSRVGPYLSCSVIIFFK